MQRTPEVLQSLLEGWNVAPYSDYSALKKERAAQQREERGPGFRPTKRPRWAPACTACTAWLLVGCVHCMAEVWTASLSLGGPAERE